MKKEIIIEYALQCLIISISVFAIGHLAIYFVINPEIYLTSNFHMFIEAARGHFMYDWVFKNWIAYWFRPLLIFKNEMTMLFVYSSITTICMLHLSRKLCEVNYGWILVLAILPFYKRLLQNSNPQVILAFWCCYPIPSLLAIFVKPHYFVFTLFHTISARLHLWGGERTRTG
jgi:hypothetical protein